MNKNHDKKTGKFTSGSGGSSQKRPSTFGIDLGKMQKNKMPKDIKKAGIDSEKYKNWVYNNWAKK